jgi:hypothetical protein
LILMLRRQRFAASYDAQGYTDDNAASWR